MRIIRVSIKIWVKTKQQQGRIVRDRGRVRVGT